MRRCRFTALAAVRVASATLLLSVRTTAAQSPADSATPAPARQARVRVTLAAAPDARAFTGRLAAWSRDSLWLAPADAGPTIGIPRSAVARLEVSRGHPGRTRRAWAAAGVGATVVGGGLLLAAAASGPPCSDCSRAAGVRLALPLGAVGVALGGYVGAVVATRGWPEAWRPSRLPDGPP